MLLFSDRRRFSTGRHLKLTRFICIRECVRIKRYVIVCKCWFLTSTQPQPTSAAHKNIYYNTFRTNTHIFLCDGKSQSAKIDAVLMFCCSGCCCCCRLRYLVFHFVFTREYMYSCVLIGIFVCENIRAQISFAASSDRRTKQPWKHLQYTKRSDRRSKQISWRLAIYQNVARLFEFSVLLAIS